MDTIGACGHPDSGVSAILPLQGTSDTMVTVKKVFLGPAVHILGMF